jgi:hypothetical protein
LSSEAEHARLRPGGLVSIENIHRGKHLERLPILRELNANATSDILRRSRNEGIFKRRSILSICTSRPVHSAFSAPPSSGIKFPAQVECEQILRTNNRHFKAKIVCEKVRDGTKYLELILSRLATRHRVPERTCMRIRTARPRWRKRNSRCEAHRAKLGIFDK